MEVKIFTKILKLGQKQTKKFWSSELSLSDSGLEAEVNEWLATKPDIQIKNVTQSQSGGSMSSPSIVVLTVWYQESLN